MKKIWIGATLCLAMTNISIAHANSAHFIKCTGGGVLDDRKGDWSTTTFNFYNLPAEQDVVLFTDLKGNRIVVNRRGDYGMALKVVNIASDTEVSGMMNLGGLKINGANGCVATVEEHSYVNVEYKQSGSTYNYICGDAEIIR